MPTRRQLIQKIELNSDASSVTFSNIPQNYTDLKLVYSIRNTNTNNYQTMNFNGSTSNFSQRELQGDGSSAGSGSRTDSLIRASVVPSNFTASTFSNTQIYIPNYTSSLYKSFNVKTIVENNSTTGYTWMISGLWSNTSTISSIGITSSMAAGSSIYLYGITHVPIIRGGEVSVRDGFKYHTFKSSGSVQVVEPGNVECLVVAGGGGGGYIGAIGGGGGAGGYRSYKLSLSPQIHSIIIGSGGAGSTSSSNPTNGSNSSFNVLSTTGGGAGGSISFTATSGGSGGGGGESVTSGASGNSGSYTPVEGYAGGNGAVDAGGGGGGASEAGTNGTRNVTAGNGGNGRQWPDSSGAYYSGGGGGSLGSSTTIAGRQGGLGGGGNGGSRNLYVSATSGLQNTGGGGGGEPNFTPLLSGGNGGSGIVIIRYPYDGN